MKATNGAAHSLNGHGLNGHGLNGNGHYRPRDKWWRKQLARGRAIFWKAVVIALVLYGISVDEEYLRYLDDVDKIGDYIDTHETAGPSKIAHDLSMPKSTVITALEYLSLKGSTDELRKDLADSSAPNWP
jgi:hypothetical protein